MKKSNFWFLTLCALLVFASVNEMSPLLRVALAANAIVVLMEVVGEIRNFKTDRS